MQVICKEPGASFFDPEKWMSLSLSVCLYPFVCLAVSGELRGGCEDQEGFLEEAVPSRVGQITLLRAPSLAGVGTGTRPGVAGLAVGLTCFWGEREGRSAGRCPDGVASSPQSPPGSRLALRETVHSAGCRVQEGTAGLGGRAQGPQDSATCQEPPTAGWTVPPRHMLGDILSSRSC